MKTNIVRTYSEMSTYKRCHRKWWYRYVEGLRPKHKSLALRIGSLIGMALEHYPDKDAMVDRFNSEIEKQKIEMDYVEFTKVVNLGINMLRIYHQTFSQRDIDWEIIKAEEEFQVPLKSPKTGYVYPYAYLAGKVDCLIRINGKLWIVEYKTTSFSDMPAYFNKLKLDGQVSGYIYGIQQKYNEPVQGVIYRVLRKSYPSPPKLLKSGVLSKDKGQNTTYEMYLETIQGYGLKIEDYESHLNWLKYNPKVYCAEQRFSRSKEEIQDYYEETLEVFKELNTHAKRYRNESHCYEFGRCTFMDICPAGKDNGELRELLYTIEQKRHTELEGVTNA